MSFTDTARFDGPSSADKDRKTVAVDPDRITIAVILARMTEFFDFFVYAIASALVFPYVFFSYADPLTATLYSFAVFSLAFIARPFGSLLFLQIDRRFGRAVKLTMALFTLCGSTMAISFLPSYDDAGMIAPLLLALFRIGQGVGLGGAWDGLVSLLAMNAPEKQRGWYAMMPQVGAAMGFGLASAFFIIFVTQLSNPEFLAWGWRFPFFVALALNVLALFARLRMIVTPEFQAMLSQHELEPKPMFEMLRSQSRVVVTGAFVPLASFALFHLVTVFPISWVVLKTDQRLSDFLFVQFVSAIIGGGMIVLSGVLADRIGRRKLLAIAAIMIGIFSFVAPILLSSGDIGRYLFVLIGFSLLGLSFGQAGGALASRFSREYRYTGASITSDISWVIGAGFAPLVALGFSAEFGLFAVGLYLLSGAVCTIIALWFSRTLDMPSE
ncbi:MHS family MFS transporter [Agrobacterium larrymoorei]|uniref:MFS transporter n=1 Tax=Agrobacterium larrymoorei TaxID=160699 RepID=UPI001571B4B0|nr:MFS transporter [Agrobacterium larrymoorei]NTJ41155.1 MHS family MFS transporter [Agrobacterium larrymoorei]